jgi:DNA-binding MarR family transcriptional regulator
MGAAMIDYFRIPGTILRDNSLSPLSRLLYSVIYKYAYNGKAEFCWASNGHLADMFEVSAATIKRCIKELIDREYIDVDYCKGRTRKIYPLCELVS